VTHLRSGAARSTRRRLATLRHGEAAAMRGMPEAVHACGDDGRSAEDVWAGVPAGAAPEAGAGAATTRS
jgi:hypothetical protein